ncbi:Enamine deaminase RidA, house cleaning of reactive enamine intermediates, YjgF/YER057c/UK114 family [Burkholderia sp. OK233]|nr:Enamine deaminase RidA, house cleaning of reactive enamine intermediates, YjgF/YER057c/UK114 family [Burkholderia sp. OK233]
MFSPGTEHDELYTCAREPRKFTCSVPTDAPAWRNTEVSGHVPLNLDGTIAQPVGRVGAEVSVKEGYAAARLVALAQLASLQKELGDLDRITAWLRVFAMINVAPGFDQMPKIANGFSDLILEVFGPDIGTHSRSAVGVALPLNVPVECEAEIEIDGGERSLV